MLQKTEIKSQMSLNEISSYAKIFKESGMYKDLASINQAAVKIMAGQSMGLDPFASISGIHIVNGKPVIGSNLIATLISNSNLYDFSVVRCDDTICELEFYKAGKSSGTVSFSIEEAKKANLAGKDVWKNYPSDMCFARAISRGARRFCPGIFGGNPIYTPEEIGADTDEDGYVINEPKNITPKDYSIEIAAMLAKHEKLMREATNDEVLKVLSTVAWKELSAYKDIQEGKDALEKLKALNAEIKQSFEKPVDESEDPQILTLRDHYVELIKSSETVDEAVEINRQALAELIKYKDTAAGKSAMSHISAALNDKPGYRKKGVVNG